jgi:membrane dipeptidase
MPSLSFRASASASASASESAPAPRRQGGLKGWHALVLMALLPAAAQAAGRVEVAWIEPASYRDAGKAARLGHLGLLKEMERLGIILDATHLCDEAFWTALDVYSGPVWASHNNCRALVDHNRQFSDQMIRALVSRGAVIGGALDAWMMVPGWVRGKSLPEPLECNLEVMLDHLDHICQIAGNADHVGIGSDLDGAYGREQSPYDLETIADLGRLPTMLAKRGYSAADIAKVMHGNWLRFLRGAWRA